MGCAVKEKDKHTLQSHFEEITSGASAANAAIKVHVARFKKAWDKKTMKLHLATHHDLEPVLDSLERALLATGGKPKHGQAPRGGLERQLQDWMRYISFDMVSGRQGSEVVARCFC